jgi:hypothetical protein
MRESAVKRKRDRALEDIWNNDWALEPPVAQHGAVFPLFKSA